jgi:hypothetical protein
MSIIRLILVVVAQLAEHVERRDEFCIIVEHALQAPDLTDRTQSRAAAMAALPAGLVRLCSNCSFLAPAHCSRCMYPSVR